MGMKTLRKIYESSKEYFAATFAETFTAFLMASLVGLFFGHFMTPEAGVAAFIAHLAARGADDVRRGQCACRCDWNVAHPKV